ncbi:MAG: sugar ABC transporter ATP-binding protein [Bryobacteraceae bacterium]|nr:sugar ABC transporter ATP-binding protein [Bryobacteraceae bacterium]
MSLLAALAIRKSFGGVKALDGVDFEVCPGEVHALVGENGAGKSTLIKVITGALQPDSGELRIGGTAVHRNSPALAQSLGVRCVYQQPALFAQLSVAENIALAIEPHAPASRVDWAARRRRASELLKGMGVALDPDREVSTLTMPEQQLLEIAKAVGAEAKLLILDEPTACLSGRETESLFSLIRRLKEKGVGVIYISHRLEELTRIASRVTVLRDGRAVAVRAMADLSTQELIQLMVGRELKDVYPKTPSAAGEVVLELRGVGRGPVRDVSLVVRAGEIVGLAGLVGSGRTELANIIFGLTPAAEGEIRLKGQPVVIDSPRKAHELGIGYVHEDRRRVGVIGAMPIVHNVTLPILDEVSSVGFFDGAKETAIAEDYRGRLGVKAESVAMPVDSLSGGNQQKVALAKWLATRPCLMILDEPTQGVDVGAKAEVHRLISDLAVQGLAVLMISSEMAEILGMSDRIVVMSAGKVAGELSRADATEEGILSLALHSHRGEAQ